MYHCVSTTKKLTFLRWTGFEPVTLAVADLRCNHRANELTGSHKGKNTGHISFLGGGGGANMNQFERLEYFFLQTRTHCVLTTKKLTMLRWTGFEPATIAEADLRFNHRANELTDACSAKRPPE